MPHQHDPNSLLQPAHTKADIGVLGYNRVKEYDELKQRYDSLARQQQVSGQPLVMSDGSVFDDGGGHASSGKVSRLQTQNNLNSKNLGELARFQY